MRRVRRVMGRRGRLGFASLAVPMLFGWSTVADISAEAASPQYCAFYAREYVKQFDLGKAQATAAVEIGDQAYYRCLNMDSAPTLPALSAYSGSDFDAVDMFEPLTAQGDAEYEETAVDTPNDTGLATVVAPPANEAPATEAPRQVAAQPATTSQPRSRSGFEPWSAEWRTWCMEHYPNSFDPKTGMVLPFEGKRTFC